VGPAIFQHSYVTLEAVFMPLASESVTTIQPQSRWPLCALALGVLVVIAVRIGIQSVTIDEADTYVYWASGKYHPAWFPHSNNHLLNSYLIWLFTRLFGLNNFSLRLPALLGAVLYLSAAYRFCISFIEGLALRLPLYGCFILTPFVLDFFVAARGYSLALGFYTAAIVAICQLFQERPTARRHLLVRLALVSVCMALSFAANFSFAFVIAISLALFLLIWIVLERSSSTIYTQLAAALLPGSLLVAALCGWTLLHWPKGQLVVGASTFREIWEAFTLFTFSDPNPHVLPPFLFRTFRHWRKALPWVFIAVCVLNVVYAIARRTRWRTRLSGIYLSLVICLTLFVHWLAFHYAGLLMPKDRTSIFFVPLCLMIFGTAAGFQRPDLVGRTLRLATIAILVVGCAYFIGCLRFRYFLLWRFDADAEETYRQLVRIVGPGHHVDVPCEYAYTSALNFYREYFHDDSFGFFWLEDNPQDAAAAHFRPYPLNQPVYVLRLPEDAQFLAEQRLKVAYRGAVSTVVIAVKPSHPGP
jgi:hypothetical protein